VSKCRTLLTLFEQSHYRILDWVDNPVNVKAPSFDVAILQEYNDIYCCKCSCWGWDDIGTWQAFLMLPEVERETEERLNNVRVFNRCRSPVIVLGCSDLVVVNTSEGILIMNKNSDCSNELKIEASQLYS
jgi:mannose-1-phosphate guanylyltransferase